MHNMIKKNIEPGPTSIAFTAIMFFHKFQILLCQNNIVYLFNLLPNIRFI